MDIVLRGAAIYFALLVILRVSGRRTLAQTTNFDLILLLIISEVTQQALVGEDFSVTTGAVLIATLIGIDVALSLARGVFPRLDRVFEGLPTVLVEDGQPLGDRMRKSRVDASDILAAARASQGLERMEQIKYAVLERNGGISIIPKESHG